MVSEIYLLTISPLRLNAILIYDTAITEWRFGIMGYGDHVISHPGGDPRDGDMRGCDFENPWAFRMVNTMMEDVGRNIHDCRDTWE